MPFINIQFPPIKWNIAMTVTGLTTIIGLNFLTTLTRILHFGNIVFLINEHYPSGMAATMRIKLFSEFLVEKNHEVKVLISNQDNGINKRFGKHNNVSYKTILSDKFPRFLLYMF